MTNAPNRNQRAGALENDDSDLNSANLAYSPPAAKPKPLSGNTDEAVTFIQHWCEGGPWVLTSISLEGGKTTTATFTASNVAEMRAWVDARQGKQNIYFTVNRTFGAVSSKPKKSDIAAGRAIHVDVDPRAGERLEDERKRILLRLQSHNPPPTVIIDSGGGYQAFWLLNEEMPLTGDAADETRHNPIEDRNRHVEVELTADSCHNIDRIMRLPGTVNVPDKKKLAKGRVARLATVVEADWTRRYALADFSSLPKIAPAGTKAEGRNSTATVNETSKLPPVEVAALPLSDRWKALIVQGKDEDDVARYNSRSEALWAVLCELVRAGCSDDTIASVILNPDFKISGHVLSQPKPRQYAARQIDRAKSEADETFECDKGGKPNSSSQRNIRLALRKLSVAVRHDTFAGRDQIDGLEGFGPAFDDAAANRLWLLIDERFKFRPSRELFITVVSDAARQNTCHPVVEYLASLQWDGVERVGGWLVFYGGAEDSEYVRAVGRLILIAAVRRVRQPGVKFDEMLVLESKQGTDKSTALKILAVREEWFTDDLPLNAEARRIIEALSGKWIIEAGELKGMRQGGANHLKGMLSRTRDKARMSYDRLEREVPRQCVIVGTTNDSRYLRDTTGNRRFWPVAIERFDLAALKRDRDQLWAEAAALEADGVPIRLDPALWSDAESEQDGRRVEDPYFESLQSVLGEEMEGKLRAKDAWKIVGKQQGMRTQDDNERLGDAMRRLGFLGKQLRFGSGPEAAYLRGDGTHRIELRISPNGEVESCYLAGKNGQEPF